MFVYYDAIVTDTPILERTYRDRILDVSDIMERLDRGEIFLNYLDECFEQTSRDSTEIDWPSMVADARANIELIREINAG